MRPLLCLTLLLPLVLAISGTALAEACGPRLIVAFAEGAPKDRFTLTNASDPGWSVTEVEIDLGPSRGKLIFDVTERGAGLSVYQPFEEAGGTAVVATRTEVGDGDTVLTIRFSKFVPGEQYVFTIDLDDTVSGSPTVISYGEISEGRVRARFASAGGASADKDAFFDEISEADTGRTETCFVS